ncbi:hypothetical protein D9619_002198 [Psilocybe cf. subviscida]|uniref:Rhodopsin domain-containing protein n=1 Tax=Psilocybe cf. subviscida TaxID=2480587 RepID=A0A8H5BGG1_9AGAR|nr:hypothetical protein D9619_002198 [Psilocybe cf. subviscida]
MTITLPVQSYTAWKVCLVILHILAICSTIFRVWIQRRTRGLWWDDYLVSLPTTLDMFFCITLFLYPRIEPKAIMMNTTAAGNYWLSLFPSYTVAWLSRICFLLLLARLFPPRHIYRRVPLILAAIFAAIYITLFGLTFPSCDGVHIFVPPSSKKMCKLPPKLNPKLLFAYIAELLSDIILVACPLLMLYKVKLSQPRDKPIVLISLGISAVTFVLVMAIAIIIYGPFVKNISYGIVIYMLGHMTSAVSLIACNMPIVACSAYRYSRRRIDKRRAPTVEMPNPSTLPVPRHATVQCSNQAGTDFAGFSEERLTYDNLTRISMSQSDGYSER